MNLDLWQDDLAVMTTSRSKLLVESSVQFISKMNYFRDKSDL